MFQAKAVLSATIQEKDYKREFAKSFPVSLTDLVSKEFTGVETKLTDEQIASIAAIDAAFPMPEHKKDEVLKFSSIKDGDNVLTQYEIADVIEWHVNASLRPAFHAVNAKFDVEQRSIARAALEKELGVAKPKKTVKADDAVQKLAETLFQFKVGETLEACILIAKGKLGLA